MRETSSLLAPFSPPDTNFVERIRYWAVATPDTTAFRYLEGDEETDSVTFAELDTQARAIAARLVSMGFAGQRALMLYPPGIDFIRAFFGCHYAGVIPVPAYPPRRNRNMGRINSISENCQASVALSVDAVASKTAGRLEDAPDLRRIPWVATEDIPEVLANDWVPPTIAGSDLGLVQYTSGSTGSPKGVMLTHANLMANCRMITESFEVRNQSTACSWLPAYHDMGLVGGILNPTFCGVTQTLMSPVSFLTYPIRWLRAISKYRVEVTGGPNFAYAWCATKIKPAQCEGLDLSSWKVAFNGAEPVRSDVMDLFSQRFAKYGFKKEAFYPCYGMAETTLLVTGGDPGVKPIVQSFDKNELVQHRVVPCDMKDKDAKLLVGCGQVCRGESVVIVNPETLKPLQDNKIGEILINSPSSGMGYWNRTEETAATFKARINPDDGKDYVRSGDLGFMHDGELFITGRLKDMIIVRGVNRYPQDIETTVEQCHRWTRSGGAAAFAVNRWDREHLVVVCEVERGRKSREFDEVINAIRAAVTSEHDLPPDAIVLVRAHSVPKTSSGKVQRHACKNAFNDSELLVIAEWVSWKETAARDEKKSADVVAQGLTNGHVSDQHGINPTVLNAVMTVVKRIGESRAKDLTVDSNIVHLGLDSMERLDIAHTLEEMFGGRMPEEVLQDVETVKEVAQAIEEHIGTELVGELVGDGSRRRSRIEGPIPESYYRLEKMPEYLRLNSLQEKIKSTGIRNPFFSVHEGRIGDTTQIDGRQLISFASYNYLGLSGHPDVSASAIDAISTFGTSVSASRIVSGEKTIHKELENELAAFLGVDDVITFPGGHACNESVIGHLVGPGDLIVHDSFAHNSIIQGAELSGARRRPFEHNNWKDLYDILKDIREDYRRVLIALEGLYSMDGDYPNLPKFVELKKRFKCWMFVDEAHSIGTLGDTGRGVAEMFGVQRDDVECWMGTLSKSFGSCGGFIAGKKELINYLRYTTPGYVFAAGMPPANVGAALGSLRVLNKSPELVKKLQDNSQLFLRLAREAGLNTGMALGTPIIPIITGDSIRALKLSEALYNAGINAQPILYPAVPEKETRVRIFMTAAHSEQQIRHTVEVLAAAWNQIKNVDVLATLESAVS